MLLYKTIDRNRHPGRHDAPTGCDALRSVQFARAVIGSIGFRRFASQRKWATNYNTL